MGTAFRRTGPGVVAGTLVVASIAVLLLGLPALSERGGQGAVLPGGVVLLHGLGRSENNMRILEWRLEALGHRVCNVGYDTRVATIEAATEEVAGAIATCALGAGPVHFVTHSLGGLVLRALLPRHPELRTGRAVMLAPPNQGSEIADRLRDLGWLAPVLGPLAVQLGTRPEDLPERLPVPGIAFGVIAGDVWINPAGPLWLPAPHDGTVSVESTRLEGMRDHLVLPYTHTFIVAAGPVAAQVDTFLRHGRFDPEGEAAGSSRRGLGGAGIDSLPSAGLKAHASFPPPRLEAERSERIRSSGSLPIGRWRSIPGASSSRRRQ